MILKNIIFHVTAKLINYNNEINIINSKFETFGLSSKIQIINLNGEILKEIELLEIGYKFYINNFLDIYYDKKIKKYFIIAYNVYYGHSLYPSVESFDIENKKIYHKYNYKNKRGKYNYCQINLIQDNFCNSVYVLESFLKGKIIIYEFHSGNILKIINTHLKINYIY